MPVVLIVDDCPVNRRLVAKQAEKLGLAVEEAENGEQALARLADGHFDLVVLDVQMPVLDGPSVVAKLRATGDKTPILILTSDTARGTVVDLIKLGIEDYILKPCKAPELATKMRKALGVDRANAAATPGATGGQSAAVASTTSGGKATVDFLLACGQEDLETELRAMLPEATTLDAAASSEDVLRLCRERAYRLVVIGSALPDDGSASLMGQLRLLQPKALVLSLGFRAAADAAAAAQANGYDGVLFKPLRSNHVEPGPGEPGPASQSSAA